MKPTIPTTFQMEWDRVSGAFEDLKEQVHERGREGERETCKEFRWTHGMDWVMSSHRMTPKLNTSDLFRMKNDIYALAKCCAWLPPEKKKNGGKKEKKSLPLLIVNCRWSTDSKNYDQDVKKESSRLIRITDFWIINHPHGKLSGFKKMENFFLFYEKRGARIPRSWRIQVHWAILLSTKGEWREIVKPFIGAFQARFQEITFHLKDRFGGLQEPSTEAALGKKKSR